MFGADCFLNKAAASCVFRTHPLKFRRPTIVFVHYYLVREYISFSDAYRSKQRKETAIGLIPLPGTHYYPAQPVLQMPRQLDCFQGDDTRLGFWQGRIHTNSHDGKTYNITEREMERHRSLPSSRFHSWLCLANHSVGAQEGYPTKRCNGSLPCSDLENVEQRLEHQVGARVNHSSAANL